MKGLLCAWVECAFCGERDWAVNMEKTNVMIGNYKGPGFICDDCQN